MFPWLSTTMSWTLTKLKDGQNPIDWAQVQDRNKLMHEFKIARPKTTSPMVAQSLDSPSISLFNCSKHVQRHVDILSDSRNFHMPISKIPPLSPHPSPSLQCFPQITLVQFGSVTKIRPHKRVKRKECAPPWRRSLETNAPGGRVSLREIVVNVCCASFWKIQSTLH